MSDDGAYPNTPSNGSARSNRLRSSVVDLALGRSPISSNSRSPPKRSPFFTVGAEQTLSGKGSGGDGGDIDEDERVERLFSRLKAAQEELDFHSQHERSHRDDMPGILSIMIHQGK
jgi:hypothetical protein